MLSYTKKYLNRLGELTIISPSLENIVKYFCYTVTLCTDTYSLYEQCTGKSEHNASANSIN